MTINRPLVPHPSSRHVLWRMQGPTHVVAAAIYKRPVGRELRVFFEPEEQGDVLQAEVARFDFSLLEEHAEVLRGLLRAQGWWPLPLDPR